ncbi:transposase [Microbulbifer sp. TRSA005]|uniref:transposase n=1 Tax=unclassified Microbulbifer TaxID=2619833 RepID=UPI00403994ED
MWCRAKGKNSLFSCSAEIANGHSCFNTIKEAGCLHNHIVYGTAQFSVEKPEFYWMNTLFGNSKSASRDTHHAISPKILSDVWQNYNIDLFWN